MRKQVAPEVTDEPEELEIDDELKVLTYGMDVLVLYPLAPRIVKILAPILQSLQGLGDLSAEGIERMLKQDVSKLGPLLMHLAEALAKPENANLPQELLKRSVAVVLDDEDGEPRRESLHDPKMINKVFRGKFFGMLRAMIHAVMVNFADFSFGGSTTAHPSKE